MGLKPGDLVRVRLRGRAMHGLVVEEREWAEQDPQELQPVESLLQRAAVDSDWYSWLCLLYTSPSPRDKRQSRMPSSA